MEYYNYFIGTFETVDSDFLNGYGSGIGSGDIFNQFEGTVQGKADGTCYSWKDSHVNF